MLVYFNFRPMMTKTALTKNPLGLPQQCKLLANYIGIATIRAKPKAGKALTRFGSDEEKPVVHTGLVMKFDNSDWVAISALTSWKDFKIREDFPLPNINLFDLGIPDAKFMNCPLLISPKIIKERYSFNFAMDSIICDTQIYNLSTEYRKTMSMVLRQFAIE
jgi:hypothetical protein